MRDTGGRGGVVVQAACTMPGVGVEVWAVQTSNMELMSVTPEVSQPETSALNEPKSLNSWFMPVIAETPQSEMGPYVAMAEVGLVL